MKKLLILFILVGLWGCSPKLVSSPKDIQTPGDQITDLTFPNRTDLSFPNDTDQWVTIDGVKYKIYLPVIRKE